MKNIIALYVREGPGFLLYGPSSSDSSSPFWLPLCNWFYVTCLVAFVTGGILNACCNVQLVLIYTLAERSYQFFEHLRSSLLNNKYKV